MYEKQLSIQLYIKPKNYLETTTQISKIGKDHIILRECVPENVTLSIPYQNLL